MRPVRPQTDRNPKSLVFFSERKKVKNVKKNARNGAQFGIPFCAKIVRQTAKTGRATCFTLIASLYLLFLVMGCGSSSQSPVIAGKMEPGDNRVSHKKFTQRRSEKPTGTSIVYNFLGVRKEKTPASTDS